ncbi:hypothetical protein DPX16_5805 [Anabarilius grahami]|uniref:Retrotransposon gag domain-containing protein n=1 Tax=Anabarilius grahami TaxID=495550 RepID=A0A3N0YV10_ANAGA|nr:hypothetical protein DPX16_5805 [Anabarilius grahami]
MNPSAQLIGLRQGDRCIEDYVTDFIELAHLTCFNEECLMIFFRGGLSGPLSAIMPLHDRDGTLEQYIEQALQLSGSSYTVGVAEEHDSSLCHVMAAAQESTHKMAVTTLPVTAFADRPEQRHAFADRPEQRHAFADRPEQRHAFQSNVTPSLIAQSNVTPSLIAQSNVTPSLIAQSHVTSLDQSGSGEGCVPV